MKQRYLRVGDDLADNVTVVVRGGALDAELLRQDALRNYAIYASYGISVFAARDLTVDELAQQPPLIRFAQLTLMTVAALHAADLRLDPTGRITPGAMILAGNHAAQAVVRIVAIDPDDQIHFTILPGPVAKNRHLLGHSVA